MLAGVAAESSQQRVAAKQVLSDMTVADIRNNPVIPYEEDCVTRLIQDDVNETAYQRIKHWTISDLREYVLNDEVTSDDIAFVRKGADLRGGGCGGQDLLQRRSDLRR